ncbi:TetR/AcrR family transcriptional regulator [Pollutimonas harenae]|uniref:TetR/AcrR family transcriptional regulator n=1 Tax=Pollutimonas harenae TaxID=657015 RepID=A0A853GWM8_9BURK|nr:TetR/AcrR family transcriptional regulator [Pollutimonas harenae]NYT85156.1 TetR/AcrR family transcriptional regulator [Pollutimonas harenae]TEA72464.1 TetR/AcrR family transcriptional regulator [Pollutimonas harenae]
MPTSTPIITKNPRGRPRSKEAEDAVLNATYRLLSEKGLHLTTIEAIAQESKVSKATIYRWWPNRAAIIMSAFLKASRNSIPYPDDFSEDDVVKRLSSMGREFLGPIGKMMAALIAEGLSDPVFAEEFRAGYINARREDGINIVNAAIAKGLIKKADPHTVLDVIYAPLYYRLMVGHQPLSDKFVKEYLSLAMTGILSNKA